jgi:saccharopine dehydrogenase-like NADP-dependent oxidoreductase
MPDKIQYITDEQGNRKSVIIDYNSYLKLMEMLEDVNLLKSMKEVDNDKNEIIDTDEFMKLLDDKINES